MIIIGLWGLGFVFQLWSWRHESYDLLNAALLCYVLAFILLGHTK